jgi:hypothetical protein
LKTANTSCFTLSGVQWLAPSATGTSISIPGQICGEAIFDVENAVELRESIGLKVQELARAERLHWSTGSSL